MSMTVSVKYRGRISTLAVTMHGLSAKDTVSTSPLHSTFDEVSVLEA
jgi:hypothetical protein